MILAIIHQDTLVSVGLRHLIDTYWGVQVDCFATAAEFMSAHPEQYEGYFIDTDNFISCLELLLPRKSRVVMLVSLSDTLSWGGMTLSTHASQEEIISCLDAGISSIARSSEIAETQGELSQREVEVLRCIAHGMLNKEIADELSISINTVLSHRKNIVAKLGIKTVSGLSLYAMMNGIIDTQ